LKQNGLLSDFAANLICSDLQTLKFMQGDNLERGGQSARYSLKTFETNGVNGGTLR
jgi:hypothetical protein